jgi:hypothetical protein
MSTVVTAVHATTGPAAHVRVTAEVIELVPGTYAVICNGDTPYFAVQPMRHPCPQRPDVLIEPGDTFSNEDDAIHFAHMHVRAHEERG